MHEQKVSALHHKEHHYRVARGGHTSFEPSSTCDNLISNLSRDAKLITKSTGCKGKYSCIKLSTHYSVAQTTPDAMHTVKDAIVNIFDLITGKDDTINY